MTATAKASDAGGSRERTAFAAAVLLFAALLTLKYFPGLENEQAYAGLAYQAIHPEAFTGDVYRGPDLPMTSRPVQLSLTYLLAKAVGDLWLDDRFLAVLYAALA